MLPVSYLVGHDKKPLKGRDEAETFIVRKISLDLRLLKEVRSTSG